MEKVMGVGVSSEIMVIHFVSPVGSEPLTPEETAALDDYLKKVEAEPISEGGIIKLVFWSKEKAQELLALPR